MAECDDELREIARDPEESLERRQWARNELDNRANYWETNPEPVHLEAWVAACLTPEAELSEIEIGFRADEWLTHQLLANCYSREEDRIRSTVSNMVGSVASATSWRGYPFLVEWWPPSAGDPSC